MRYWIYWNDLVQGPFDLDELVSLHAFSEDLPVCMEDRQDWLPAARIADLAPAVELWRERRYAPPPPPPPPAPTQPPLLSPLQGEFLVETADQPTLFDLQANGFRASPPASYAFRSIEETLPSPDVPPAAFTMPIYFPTRSAPAPAVVLPPPPLPQAPPSIVARSPVPEAPPSAEPPKPLFFAAPPSAVKMPEAAVPPPAPIVEPEIHLPEISVAPAPIAPPVMPAEPLDDRAAPAELAEETTTKKPRVRTIRRPWPSKRSRVDEDLEGPLAAAAPVSVQTVSIPLDPPLSIDEEISGSPRSGLGPWLLGGAFLLLFLLSGLYWCMDRFTSHAAIAAAAHRLSVHHSPTQRKEAPVVSVPVPAPVVAEIFPPSVPVAPTPLSRPVETEKRSLHRLGHAAAKLKKKKTPVADTALPAAHAVSKVSPAAAQATPVVSMPRVEAPPSAPSVSAPDAWAGKQSDAINLVMSHLIVNGKGSVQDQAKAMLAEMHDKELLHAGDTGERLYLPDKLAWSALREEGATYRVYLNFSALEGNGERTQIRSYQFVAELAKRQVTSDDNGTLQDFLNATALTTHIFNQKAFDIESVLSAVDVVNKQRLRSMIVHKGRSSKAEQTSIQAGLKKAEEKLQRQLAYFKRAYPEKTLQNVALAYEFVPLIKN